MKMFKLKNKAEGTKKKKDRERENERKGKGKKGTTRQECKGLGPVLDELLPGDFCFPKALDFWTLISTYTLKF